MKILVVSTISNTINAFLIPHLELLYEMGFVIDVACKIQQPLDSQVYAICRNVIELPFSRKPYSVGNFRAATMLKEVVVKENYDILHTHTPVASTISRIIIRQVKSKVKVIYTAHGFHFYKGAPWRDWILYYPIERCLAHYTDVLLTINEEDYRRALSFSAKRVLKIQGVGIRNHGNGENQNTSHARQRIRDEFGIPADATLLLSVGELNSNKNHLAVLRALPYCNERNIYYIVCGEGAKLQALKAVSVSLCVSDRVFFAGFRQDVHDFLFAADIFVFPSKREGLPVSLVEAMACGLPVICSNIRGNIDLIEDRVGGLLIEPDNYIQLADAIQTMLKQNDFFRRVGETNMRAVKPFELGNVIHTMKIIYGDILDAK